MGYLRFSRDHPSLFVFITSFFIFFPISFLLFIFGTDLNLDIPSFALVSALLSFIFALIFSVAILRYPRSTAVTRFVDDLGLIVNKRITFSQGWLIITPNFNPLKIIDMVSLPKSADPSKTSRLHSTSPVGTAGLALAEQVRDMVQENFVGNFYLEFFLSEKDVKFGFPEFHYISYLALLKNNCKNWKSLYSSYPELNTIIQKLPSWVKHAEIYHQGHDILAGLFVDRLFCIKNPTLVYGELVQLKKNLMQSS